MLISPAYAQVGGGTEMFASFIPLILIFAVFYFLLVRPQQKKMKQHREMLGSIQRGDRVVTGGGIVGTVARVVSEDELQVDLAEGVRVRVMRGMIANVLARGEPVNDDEPAEEGEARMRSSRRSRRRKPKSDGDRDRDQGETEASADDDGEGKAAPTVTPDAGNDVEPRDGRS
ncbi:MAG: preprotein translocase subunit YajC [Acetobacterales bacterium]